MVAGYHFTDLLSESISKVDRIQVDLYGSLSLTGKGHHTDRAIILGLMGNKPDIIKMTSAKQALQDTFENHTLLLANKQEIRFEYERDIIFHTTNLPLHENGMTVTAYDSSGSQLKMETYYSIGGGFILTAHELENGSSDEPIEVPFHLLLLNKCLKWQRKKGLV